MTNSAASSLEFHSTSSSSISGEALKSPVWRVVSPVGSRSTNIRLPGQWFASRAVRWTPATTASSPTSIVMNSRSGSLNLDTARRLVTVEQMMGLSQCLPRPT